MKTKMIKAFGIIFLLLIFAGCASFEKEMLERVSSYPDLSHYKNKPTAHIDLKFFRGTPGGYPVDEVPATLKLIKPIIDNALRNSQLFSQYNFYPIENNDYKIKINIYAQGSFNSTLVSLCGMTLGIIPCFYTEYYILQLSVFDSNGELLSIHKNKDAIKGWLGIWFIPAMGHTFKKAISNTLDNQMRVALTELFESGALNSSDN